MNNKTATYILAALLIAAASRVLSAGEMETLSSSGFGALEAAMTDVQARLADNPVESKQQLLDSKLIEAVRSMDTAEIRRLVALGADPNAYDGLNFTPLTTAVMDNGDLDVMNTLFDLGARADEKGTCDVTALHMAAENGRLEAARLLVAHHAQPDAKSCAGETPLFEAVKAGSPDVAAFLLGLGADPNASDFEKKTALMTAVAMYAPAQKDLLALLLGDRRTDVNARDEKGMTALKLVVQDGDVDLVKVLLAAPGINVNDDAGGVSALFLARLDNRQDIVDLLLKAGAASGAGPLSKRS